MRPPMLLMPLLLLVMLVANDTRGALLEDKSLASLDKEVHEKERPTEGGSGGSHRHCSGKNRKLMVSATTTSKSERTKGEGDGSREDLRSTVPSPFEQPQTYLDILDSAGTDYAPAGRTPPIHN
ncbi:hypothetical protein C4D60_Mb10t20510 [Musa balbisiana]|uniref:Uncharacterized protein n=1 Tax=Musa balbisiana TaxID=52838 RepID=A0A4S8IZZ5_MUSBA|nr:hypothetical protein C4D60_Mb10t20510 [Musa balbisiana]